MSKEDLGMYLIIWLMTNVIIWLTDIEGVISVKAKLLLPIALTVFVVLFRVAVFLITGE